MTTYGTRYFIDAEFHEDGKTIDLLSLALRCDDGRELYLVNSDNVVMLRAMDNKWLRENVMDKIGEPYMRYANGGETRLHPMMRKEMARQIVGFVHGDVHESLEFWGYYADYDWVVFAQIFGKMIDLPSRFPWFCLDLKQLAWSRGIKDLSAFIQPTNEHNAMADARWNETLYNHLIKMETIDGR